MNKVILGIIAFLVLGAGAVLVASNDDSDNVASSNQQATLENPAQEVSEVNKSESESEGYVDYSETALASSKGTKQIVFFHASWCSTCNAYEKEIVAGGVPEGITILKADYDSDTELKQKYDVRLQSTFVLLDENGNVERSWPFGQGLSNDITNLYEQVI